ncbi:Calx-beta domain-containing protein [Hydrocarboniclastica marina]|uniref:DUF1566 domain-containing protein n=1 Tax=Hydrocarboniclastica marina TaxID=2259620 RepID=A0A4P7XLJ8_9ALTE|nr:Calx-beta domain-containing protein [Hydrocarboniclastica marina]QCF28126.1 DUF1566 domain-containing protein [Hydrocarboniclastica marina]
MISAQEPFKRTLLCLAMATSFAVVTGCGGSDSGDDSSSTSKNSSGSGSESSITPEISVDEAKIREGNSGVSNVQLRINLSDSSDEEVSVTLVTKDGTATSGSDYRSEQVSVVFPPGSRRQEIALDIIADQALEDDEWFEVELSSPKNGRLGNRGRTARVSITNDDEQPQVYFTTAEQTVAETVRYANVTIALDNVSGFDTDILLNLEGTATEGDDFSMSEISTVTIPAGSLSETLDIEIIGDAIPEGGETVILGIESATNAKPSAGDLPASHTLTIAGDIALNDTGVTSFSDGFSYGLGAEPGTAPGQDASFGRDSSEPDQTDGHAGFSFTKLDNHGNPLPGSATSWQCTRDNVTGLVWENKEQASEPDMTIWRSASYTYTWYVEDDSINGGNKGAPLESNRLDRRAPLGQTCAYLADDERRNNVYCRTSSYIEEANTRGLCGFDDWRLPAATELRSIYSYSSDSAVTTPDSAFFSNYGAVDGVAYYSSTPSADNDASAWCVDAAVGAIQLCQKNDRQRIRLVRSAEGNSK